MPAIVKPLAGRGTSTSDLKHELGQYVRDCREARGMTQADLARAVGMTYYTAISAIEIGRNSVPPERYMAFAEALGVNPKTFVRNVLRLTNPWAFVLLFSNDPKKETERLNATLTSRHNGGAKT